MFKRTFVTTSALLIFVLGILILGPSLYPKIETHYLALKSKQTKEQALEQLSKEPEKSAYLEVPFICQAPLETEANWTLHEESCEEAAFLQAYLYETGQTVSKEEANEIILDMINWQKQNMGGHHDLYAEDMIKFISGYQNIPAEQIILIKNAGIKEIKAAISEGHPVIVPITGEILKNPYYPYPGYHMLTVIGYTEDSIITNDNGTRRGKDFSYKVDIFESAMKDAGGNIIILDLNKNE